MNKLPLLFGLAAALAPSFPGLTAAPPLRGHLNKRSCSVFNGPDPEPQPLPLADQERIAAAQAKRERKAARLAAIARVA
jgi:hypothetical protein